jgi:hypothetical protein
MPARTFATTLLPAFPTTLAAAPPWLVEAAAVDAVVTAVAATGPAIRV